MSNTILTVKELNIILNSDEIKNTVRYGGLYKTLLNINCKKAISLNDIIQDKPAVEMLQKNKDILLHNSKQEWTYVGNITITNPFEKARCFICNRQHKNVYYIKNIKNNKIFGVGPTCAENFPNIQKDINAKCIPYKDDPMKIVRKVEFQNKFKALDIEKFLNTEENFYSIYFLNLPADLWQALNVSISKMNDIYYTYINIGISPYESSLHPLSLFEKELANYYILKNQSHEYIQD